MLEKLTPNIMVESVNDTVPAEIVLEMRKTFYVMR